MAGEQSIVNDGGGLGVKNFSDQGALRLRDGFQEGFRLFPERSWNAP
jgi:hypothetical protein